MNTQPLTPSDTSKLLAALMETTLGIKHLFGQTRSQDATMLQIQALGILHTMPGLSPTVLGQKLYLSSSAMAQLLQRLTEAGWVRRDANRADLRAVELSATPEGIAVLGRYGEAQNKEHLRQVFNTLTREEKQQLTSLLKKLNVTLQKDITDEKE